MNEAATILQVEDKPDDVELIQYAFAKAAIANPLMVVIDGDDAVNTSPESIALPIAAATRTPILSNRSVAKDCSR